jgi:1-phosphatidylinositol-3-phosphate 5-kinase
VLKNSITDRRMKSEINNPRILLIGNSIGFTQKDLGIDLETYVRQENHYIDVLMDRIELVKPNVIIIEKDISRFVMTKIRELNITVITNVKRKEMEKIARCTETLIMPSVNLLEKHINLGS